MVNRVLFDPNAFKISKPGYDVLTTTLDEQLIVDGSKPGMGIFQTGTVTINGLQEVNVSYSNPYGTIPFAFAQYVSGSQSYGGGFYYNSTTTGVTDDTVPPTTFYTTSYNSTNCIGCDVIPSSADIKIRNKTTSSKTFRYYIFFAALASNTGGSYNMTLSPTPNWTNASGTASTTVRYPTNVQTMQGIEGAITLRIRTSDGTTLPTGCTIRVVIDGSEPVALTAGNSSTTFAVTPGQGVGFNIVSSVAFNKTMVVDNISTGVNSIDTFVMTVTATPDTTIETNWPNNSTTGSSGGGVTWLSTFSNATIATINQPVSIYLHFGRTITTQEIVVIYVNGAAIFGTDSGIQSPNFTVNNGDYVQFEHRSVTNSTLNFSVRYAASSLNIDTFTTQIVDTSSGPDYTPNPIDWSDITVTTYNNIDINYNGSSSNVRTVSGVNQTLTWRFHLSAPVGSGATIQMYKNGSTLVASLTGASIYQDFNVVNGDTLHPRVQKSLVGNTTVVGLVTSLDTGVTLDTFNITLTKNSGPPE